MQNEDLKQQQEVIISNASWLCFVLANDAW